MRLCQIKVLYIMHLILGKSVVRVKNSFLFKTKAHLASWQPKKLI